jgi:hypothetical protein
MQSRLILCSFSRDQSEIGRESGDGTARENWDDNKASWKMPLNPDGLGANEGLERQRNVS